MKLQMLALTDAPPKVVRAQRRRSWMDEFPGHHPYRCLPLAIANTYGWDVLSPFTFTATWNGGPAAGDLTLHSDAPHLAHFASSNFARGVLTLHTGYLFHTDPGWHLMAGGPLNVFKDGIVPLSGILESDWLPYPFTMNWQFTRAASVRFEAGEPFCRIFPLPAQAIQAVEPEIHRIEERPELHRQYQLWRERRDEFLAKYRQGDAAALQQAWQKFYFQGKYADGSGPDAAHTSKLELAEPRDCRAADRNRHSD
jgi:hypothetical protein